MNINHASRKILMLIAIPATVSSNQPQTKQQQHSRSTIAIRATRGASASVVEFELRCRGNHPMRGTKNDIKKLRGRDIPIDSGSCLSRAEESCRR
jgi:hypothetical protein